MKTIAERIQELIQAEGLTNTEFAKRTDINPAIISHILSGRNKPSLQVITSIKEVFTNVNLDYLITGSGALYNDFTNVNIANTKPPHLSLEFDNPSTPPEPRIEKRQEPKLDTESPPTTEPEKKTPAPISENKAVEQIVIFYADGSFKAYHL